MSVEALAWAFTVPLPPSEKLVLLALADRSGNRFDCYPSVTDVTVRTGLSDRTVRTALASLADRGVIRIERRKHPGRGWTSNLYEMLVDGDTRRRLEERLLRARDRDADLTSGYPTPPAIVAPPPPAIVAPPLLRGLQDMNPYLETEDSSQPRARVAAVQEEPKPEAPPPAPPPQDATRTSLELPPDWQPSSEDRAYATALGLDPDVLLVDFVGYWTSRAPGRGLSRNWSWNWQRWCRREIEFRSERGGRSDRALRSVASASPATGPALVGPSVATRVPADMVAPIQARLASNEARPLWAWALSREDVRFVWDTTAGPKPMPAFTAGRGYLNRIIINLASEAGLERISERDCALVAEWMQELEHVGDAIEVAETTLRRARARWKSDLPPFSLRPFDAEVRAALAGAGRTRTKQMAVA